MEDCHTTTNSSGRQTFISLCRGRAQRTLDQIANEEELLFLSNPDIPEGQGTQELVITYNAAHHANDWMHMTLIETNLNSVMSSSQQSNVVNHLETRRSNQLIAISFLIPHAVEQHRIESKTFEVKMNQVLNENERLLEQVMSKDIVNLLVNPSMENDSVNVHEFDTQLKQEIFQRENSVSNQSVPSFDQLFELNELKAQSQEKDMVIKKLKERIKSLSGIMFQTTLVIQIVLWYLDSGCSKHMTGDRSQLTNFVNKFLGTVKFGNDHVAKIMGCSKWQAGRPSRGDNLYTLSLGDMMASSPICPLSKASKTKSWLWHRHLSHLNFEAINHLAKHGLVRGLPKLKFKKDHLCSACALGKSTKKPHKPTSEDTNQEKLYLLHMDLCGPMRIASVNGKKYILVIVDDYSRFTWVKCLRSKDEAPKHYYQLFLKMIQVRLKETVRRIRTDNGSEFVNQTLPEYYEKVGISHETSVACSPQQNGVAEAVATACYTQNRFHEGRPTRENLGKLQPKADIGIFIGYAPRKKALWIYNRRTRRIIETIHVDFDKLTAMASEHSSLGPAPHEITPAQHSESAKPYNPSAELTLLYFLLTQPVHRHKHILTQDASSLSNSQTTPETEPPIILNDVEEDNHDIKVAHMALFYYYDAFLTAVEPKTYKDALTQACWIESMQEELNKVRKHLSLAYRKALKCGKRIFRYLKGTVHQGLWYPKDSSIALTAFADANHASYQDTCRSTSGSMQFLGNRLVTSPSKRQKRVAISKWDRHYFVNTEYQLADIFTKALGRNRIEFLINKLGMRSFTPETLKQLADEVDE
ncbi:retrovirus-related pol polyprotein from transposon TNT 1-94 [Tanacetum coccineum]